MTTNLYRVYSAAVPTTAAMVPIATGTAIKTHLQLTAGAKDLTVVSWGVDFSTVPSAFVTVELIHTTTVAGTGATAVVPTIMQGSNASLCTAGFAPTAEGSVVATTRVIDQKQMLTNSYSWEWSLGREPEHPASGVLRIRMTTTVTINAICFIQYEE